uniref:Reverse transcriptase Ty1/copia-type domain-containing protein n=1 Tax=Eucampia antarctica TaxID=49252 RepID=A0A7S2W8N9_9STRA|mmetsp:Transcript_23521/g.22553  ORF Transcript_23521/g.22553 Transcript_23521/m.22553 type:complete len:104 (+) Transcript_23521:360-671(+)
MALYLRSLLDELNIKQTAATKLYEDNSGAISMANAQRPTRRTRHLDIRCFALLDWVETDQIVMETISTHDNPANTLTKILGPQLLSRHSSTLLGKRKPMYCTF